MFTDVLPALKYAEYGWPVFEVDADFHGIVRTQRREQFTICPTFNDREGIELYIACYEQLQQLSGRCASLNQVFPGARRTRLTSQACIPSKPIGMLDIATFREFTAD